MLPVWQFGRWSIHAYDVLVLLGAAVWALAAEHRLQRLKAPQAQISLAVWLTALGTGLGKFLVGLVPTLRHYATTGTLVWLRGSGATGALLGGAGAAALACWLFRLPLPQFLDQIGLPIPLGMAIGRLGCFAAGCCYGRATESWLGVYLPDLQGEWAVRYPTQLMSAAYNLLAFVGLCALERHVRRRESANMRPWWAFDGLLYLVFMGLYGLKRLLLDFMRADAVRLYGALTWGHLYSVYGIAIVTTLIVGKLRDRALPLDRTSTQP